MKQLKLKNPCSEKWENMQGEGKEKLCLSCDRKVIDFQDKSVAGIIEILENTKERTCARVKRSQLNPVRKIAAAVLIGGMLLGGSCTSQRLDNNHYPTSKSTIKMENEEVVPNQTNRVEISGKVLLENEEAIGATLCIVGRNYNCNVGTVTEYDGTFSLELTLDDNLRKYDLEVSYLGYDTFIIPLGKVNLKKGIEITLVEDELILYIGELIIETKTKNG